MCGEGDLDDGLPVQKICSLWLFLECLVKSKGMIEKKKQLRQRNHMTKYNREVKKLPSKLLSKLPVILNN